VSLIILDENTRAGEISQKSLELVLELNDLVAREDDADALLRVRLQRSRAVCPK
jgi:hypothetical protein